MAKEFYAMYNSLPPEGEKVGKPSAVFLVDGDEVRISSSDDSIIEKWGKYVKKSSGWAKHVETGWPLSSLLGTMSYVNGKALPYNSKTALIYEKMVKAVGGKTRDFKPEKTKRTRK